MAHSYLGRVYANLDESELAAESIRRAWELRGKTSEHERLGITERYEALVTGDWERVREVSEEWIRMYPRDPQPYVGLALAHQAVGQFEEALAASRKAIAADPDFVPGYTGVAEAQMELNHLADAEEAVKRGLGRGLQSDEFFMEQYAAAFLRGDEPRMRAVASDARERNSAGNWVSNQEAYTLAYRGRLEQARAASKRAVEQAESAGQSERAGLWLAGAAIREAFFGNRKEAKEYAAAARTHSKNRELEFGAAFALALVGESKEAEALTDDLQKRFAESTSMRYCYGPALRAQLALTRGDAAGALALLEVVGPYEAGVHESSVHALFGAMYSAYVRGEAYLALGHGADAAAEFQKLVARPEIVLSDPVGVVARIEKARGLERAGKRVEARAAYDDFLSMWKDADAGIPILVNAKRERGKLAVD